MKQLIVITCLLCCFAWGYSQPSHDPPAPPRKSMSLSAVEAIQGEGCINIYFNQSLSNISINVVTQRGNTVYQSKLDAVQGSQLTIHTLWWITGTYSLQIIDHEGLLIKEFSFYKE